MARRPHSRVDTGRLLLVVVDGRDDGTQLVLPDGPAVVGREPGCALVLSDPAVPRRALEVTRTGNEVRIRALDGGQGTFYGDARVGEIVVGPGATLRVGGTGLRIEAGEHVLSPEPSKLDRFGALRGRSRAMREIFSLLGELAPTDETVLVEGEAGTGKERVARTLHEHSRRAHGPYLVVECAVLSRDLLASHLFGTQGRPGALERATGGTVFLRAVDRLDLSLQQGLLVALERGQVRRADGGAPVPVDVRVVAASTRNLKSEARSGRFREPLYYRLARTRMVLPPLRDRPEDVPLLVDTLLDVLAAEPEARRRILTPKNLSALVAHRWPGNVRELATLVEAVLPRAVSKDVDLAHRIADPDDDGDEAEAGPGRPSEPPLDGTLSLPFKSAKQSWIALFERRYIGGLLRRNAWNVSGASREAEMDRKYLMALIKKHGLRDVGVGPD